MFVNGEIIWSSYFKFDIEVILKTENQKYDFENVKIEIK